MELSLAWNVPWEHIRIMTNKRIVTHAQLEPIQRVPEVRHWKTACVSNCYLFSSIFILGYKKWLAQNIETVVYHLPKMSGNFGQNLNSKTVLTRQTGHFSR